MTDRDRFEAAAASCGLHFNSPIEQLAMQWAGKRPHASLNQHTGAVTYPEEHEETDEVRCMKRTLASEPER